MTRLQLLINEGDLTVVGTPLKPFAKLRGVIDVVEVRIVEVHPTEKWSRGIFRKPRQGRIDDLIRTSLGKTMAVFGLWEASRHHMWRTALLKPNFYPAHKMRRRPQWHIAARTSVWANVGKSTFKLLIPLLNNPCLKGYTPVWIEA